MGKNNGNKSTTKNNNNFNLKNVAPLTNNQKVFFDSFDDYQVISLTGSAGTGKSYIALYKALEAYENDDTIHNVKIVRSAVSSRDIGFLPGGQEEKLEVYEGPYIDIVHDLYNRADAYSIMRQKGIITFDSTSFLRGLTFTNCVIVLDEAQNLGDVELFTLLTRIGENCKIVICGDVRQDDLTSERFKENSGYPKTLEVLNNMREAKTIHFGPSDIVRSDWVRNFIIAYENHNKKGGEIVRVLDLLETEAA